MNATRIARATARVRPIPIRLPLQRRNYADAVSDKIKLTLALPHQVRDVSNWALHSQTHRNWSRLTLVVTLVNLQIDRRVCSSIPPSPANLLLYDEEFQR